MDLTIKEIQRRAREIVETGSKKQAIHLLDEISTREVIDDRFEYVYEVEERSYMFLKSTDEPPNYVSRTLFNSPKKALAYFDERKQATANLACPHSKELRSYVDRDRLDAMGMYLIIDGTFATMVKLTYHVVGVGEEQNNEDLRLDSIIQEKINHYWEERKNEHPEH